MLYCRYWYKTSTFVLWTRVLQGAAVLVFCWPLKRVFVYKHPRHFQREMYQVIQGFLAFDLNHASVFALWLSPFCDCRYPERHQRQRKGPGGVVRRYRWTEPTNGRVPAGHQSQTWLLPHLLTGGQGGGELQPYAHLSPPFCPASCAQGRFWFTAFGMYSFL